MLRHILLATLLGGCANAGPSSTGANFSCAPLPGWEDVASASKGKFLIFGELHGTSEGPKAVQEFVCQVARKPVLLALELDSPRNEELQAAWVQAGPGDGPLVEKVSDIFSNRLDGVGSQALLEMLKHLWALKRSGAQIDVVAFNGAKNPDQAARFANLPGQEPHEAAQAENIRIAAGRRAYDHVVVLVGSLHARKSLVVAGGASFEPMAMKLAPPDQVIALRMEWAGGTAWNCQLKATVKPPERKIQQSDLDCSGHPVRGQSASEPGMRIAPFADGSYDGVYSLGIVNASPPPAPAPAP